MNELKRARATSARLDSKCSRANVGVRIAVEGLAAGLLLANVGSALAEMRYVDANNTNPRPPYTTWATAAGTLQQAVDASAAGDEIMVTNGVYATGGKTVYSVNNRVAIDKPITLRSANGAANTVIDGSGLVRCAYLTNGASLSGFTLTNGSAQNGGGGLWCESTNAVISDCILTGNSGASSYGGGAYQGTLNNCTLTRNSAIYGAGAYYSTLNRCVLTDNSATFGGGAYNCRLYNCALSANYASDNGGGSFYSTLNNCTLAGNSAFYSGGGSSDDTLNNCIVYFNTAPQGANYDYGTFNYSCTTPMPTNGLGNIEANPLLASASHLSADSPCRGLANAAYANGSDIDGEPWERPPSIGCDEYHPGSLTGPLSADVSAAFTNVPVGFVVQLRALIEGRTTASTWDFGDSTTVTNQPYVSHAWSAPGDYLVVLRAYNEIHTAGVAAAMVVHIVAQPIHYVAADSPNPLAPYNSWATAAKNIQNAVDAVSLPGSLVLVTNGIYAQGSRVVYNTAYRLVIDKLLTVRSVNGPQFTAIDGAGSIPCVYLTNSAALSGFTVTNGFAQYTGGGVFCESTREVISNCVLTGNSASNSVGGAVYRGTLTNCTLSGNSALYGGGASSSVLNNCTLVRNVASYYGGGVYLSTLNNCVLSGNSAPTGGGAAGGSLNNCALTGNSASTGGGASGYYYYDYWYDYGSWIPVTLNNCTLSGNSARSLGGGTLWATLNNCLIYFNTAPLDPNCASPSELNYCCTTPRPAIGIGNISLDPQLASAWHLSSTSPCRGAGNASYASGTDLDGEPWGSPPSIGCDEYQAGALTGALSASISADFTNVAVGFPVNFTALIGGRSTASVWDFGDGTSATNEPYISHLWTAPGNYGVVLHTFNEDHTGGVNAAMTIHVVEQPILYVAADSPNPVAPYNSWATAARDIQDAVDAYAEGSPPGALVLVTNGIYGTTWRVVNWATNRVVIDKILTVQSVNGPAFTAIDGGGLFGCAYLTNKAALSGLTLTNGGSYSAAVICESQLAVVSNCVVMGNASMGVFGGTLNNCALTGNTGGGASSCTLNDCTVTGNHGTGANSCTLNNCMLAGNSSYIGGGAYQSTLNNCILTGNSAYQGGGGFFCTLNSCALMNNTAYSRGGAVAGGTLNNCTLAGNSAWYDGGGATYGVIYYNYYGWFVHELELFTDQASGDFPVDLTQQKIPLSRPRPPPQYFPVTLNNCIVEFNTAPQGENYDSATLNYCCTTPQPTTGMGNISLDPELASASHLSATSPCRGAGNPVYSTGCDIDGEPWADPPSIGCDEYRAGAVIGPLNLAITASFTNVLPDFTVHLTASIEGRTTASVWDFGDGSSVTNRPYTSHAWAALGDYPVVLRAYNESQPGGISATVIVHVVTQPIYYVAVNSANPVAPYSSWATAATNIQDAVDVAIVPGALVLVTNGVYANGGQELYTTLNRVMIDKFLTVQSVNGPQFTIIDGGHTARCAYLTNGAGLSGFTLANGYADRGGGVLCETLTNVVSNCLLKSNTADYLGGAAYGGTLNNCVLSGNVSTNSGGGAYGNTLNNCTLTGNTAPSGYGGGAYYCTLDNCVLTGNSAQNGGAVHLGTLNNCTLTDNSAVYSTGGASDCTLNNCILYFNTAQQGSNYDPASQLSYCCTTPLPTKGVGNLSLDPQLASASHLGAGSPCRGAGNSAYATGTDIDGEPWASPPSIGCDEYRIGGLTGPLTLSISSAFTEAATGFSVELTGLIEGRPSTSVWSFGDGSAATNQPFTSHVWETAGDYEVVLRAYNESLPGGIAATVTVHVVTKPVHYVAANNPTPIAPYTSWTTAANNIQDAVDAALVPGALVLVTNGIYTQGSRIAYGSTNRVVIDKLVTVRSVNGPSVTLIDGSRSVRCAILTNDATLSGFTLTNGSAVLGGGVWCASSSESLYNCVLSHNSAQFGGGVYGGTLSNCTLNANSATDGGGAYSDWMNNCSLADCTLTGNFCSGSGGAVFGGTLNHCSLIGNSAADGGGAYYASLDQCSISYNSCSYNGGGANSSTLNNCVLLGNSASFGPGGGASYCTLNNCSLVTNSAPNGAGESYCALNNCVLVSNVATNSGGGANGGVLNNCIVYFNSAPADANYDLYSFLNYCCTSPQPTNGFGNFTNTPLFVDPASGNLRLQAHSACINAGLNSSAPPGPDLDGNPRIAGGTVDIGAYEFQAPSSTISYAWLQQYGLPTDGSADFVDSDGDGMSNWQEWVCGTNPTNAASALRLLAPTADGTNVILTWQSVGGVSYSVERTGNAARTFEPLAKGIVGQPVMTTWMDTNAAASTRPLFYRVSVATHGKGN